jgi:hypothetical protein
MNTDRTMKTKKGKAVSLRKSPTLTAAEQIVSEAQQSPTSGKVTVYVGAVTIYIEVATQ